MRNIVKTISFFILILSSSSVLAHGYQQGDIRIGHVWTRATPEGTSTAAIYLPLLNTGKISDKLIGITSPDANHIQIHDHIDDNGIMKMPVLDFVVLEPNQPISFQPMGKHLMVTGLKHPLKAGDKFPLTLEFEKAGRIDIEAEVASPNISEEHHH